MNRQTTRRTTTAAITSAVTIIPTSNPEKLKKVERGWWKFIDSQQNAIPTIVTQAL